MQFPLTYEQISFWLAIISILLLATSELLTEYSEIMNIVVQKKRLRRLALLFSILFLISTLVPIYIIITSQ